MRKEVEMHKNFEGNPFSKGKGPKDGGVISVIHGKGDCNNNPRPHSFVNLSSGNCAGKNSSSASAISNENVSSSAIFNGNSKNTENSMQSSDGVLSAKSEVDTWRAPGKLTYTGEDEILDAAQRTESSCSNSYFIHPLCSSNDNYLETSIETKSSVPNGCSSGVPAGAETKASIETKEDNKRDSSRSLCSKEDLHPESALEDRKVLAAEKQSRTMKHKYVAVKEENELVNRFDLNDDIPRSGLNNHKQSVSEGREAVSSSNVVRPRAKLGVPLCLPISTKKFGGELGWRGTSVTSAFCLVSAVKTLIDLNLTAEEDCPAIGFPWANEKKPGVSHFKHSSYSDSKPGEKFTIDLNAPGDNADIDCPQSSFPVNFTKNASMDFNLNDDPSIHDHLQLQRNPTFGIKTPEQAAVPSLPTKRHPREHLNILGPVYRGDLSHMPVFNHARGQPVLVGPPNLLQPVERLHRFVPVQPQLSPYTMQVVPSYCYPSNGSFFIAQADSLPAHNLCYGTRDPHGNTVFPQVPNFPGAPYLLGPVRGQTPSGGADLQPRYEINSGDFSSMNGSWKENTTRQLLIPSQNTELKFSQPAKRREPEGGWEAYQLGLKHTPSSH
ncbi:PREDICTED: uncharacterized protein LOC109176239 isoform X2 [Ipomoea nil]|uniref:uncharacterized protein LOC109176239 isoform X2 n=1 Tax=Ipomoea nil TaxID=35883 RepID=UPI000901BF20|nr:PREDICTED: uncharacterized protein LOC109176239 isoform X2 [Ipomoea nil]